MHLKTGLKFCVFFQNSLKKTVEETTLDNVFTLNVLRHKASFGKVAVDWSAEGNVNDITPTSGQVCAH